MRCLSTPHPGEVVRNLLLHSAPQHSVPRALGGRATLASEETPDFPTAFVSHEPQSHVCAPARPLSLLTNRRRGRLTIFNTPTGQLLDLRRKRLTTEAKVKPVCSSAAHPTFHDLPLEETYPFNTLVREA